MNLADAEFPAYFEAVHGRQPFPWQTRLLETVLSGTWPDTISLPTASGKTAVLDVAVFALACQASRPAQERTAPRRIALIVDRRIVVDDAFARATKIHQALADASTGILKKVADALKLLGGETPLDIAQLRGGIYREDRWARTPAQPVILCSTVDQVGSRLLFRGYGLSSSMWPIHAGLLGNDTLIILDEAHCSQPFLQTLSWVEKFRGMANSGLAAPFKVIAMTATPRSANHPFTLSDADYRNDVLQKRLAAHKPAMLETCGKKDEDFARKAIEHLRNLAKPGTSTLVVVNRVSTARELRSRLAKLQIAHGGDKLDAASILLTGRCRPLERDELLNCWRHRLMAGRDRTSVAQEKPLIVIATQCVEVGADLDMDALITECCAFDALRQRFGRLDRLGERGESSAVILCRDDQVGKPDEPVEDPIYGEALSRTWQWLLAKNGNAKTIDLGIAAVDGLPGQPGILSATPDGRASELAPLSAPAANAPVIFPVYCDLWSQTGPEPAISPDPAIFLHGPQTGEPDVRIIWRTDLDPAQSNVWADTIALCPPVSGEAMPLPLHLARRWLAGELKGTVDSGDLESIRTEDGIYSKDITFRHALRWRGPEQSAVATGPGEIRPGDTLILPASYGGCDKEGWNPEFNGVVADLADIARMNAQRPAVLRLHATLPLPSSLQRWCRLNGEEWPDDLKAQLLDTLGQVPKEDAAYPLAILLYKSNKRLRIEAHPSGNGLVLACDLRSAGSAVRDFSDEDDTSAKASGQVGLIAHLADVQERARIMAKAAGVSSGIAADIALAARLHDLGKADPRFQTLLAGGDRLRARRQGLLAKSARVPASITALTSARKRAGYPEGGRHELLSVRLAESVPELLALAHDRDLVLHLVASHHGHCRPFAPVVVDERPLMVTCEVDGHALLASSKTGLERLDSGVAERYWSLARKYGWWGLAYLEACMRLADHRASESPSVIVEEDAP